MTLVGHSRRAGHTLGLLHRLPKGLTIASAAPTLASSGGIVETLDKWFLDQAQTPMGSLLLFVLVFLARLALDQRYRRKQHTKARKRKEA